MNDVQMKQTLHAPDIEPKIRHRSIMKAFDELNSGEFMELTNNHDPKPLYYMFLIEREGQFTWEYREQGPDLWRIVIGKN
ncbi:DUF2249 domain-containing protein [Lysinibacillus antri]|uniref:DUF2249 domain-containing protein n=1 Tax=Lysinibacillus antri TaxID=2498145 RepID=A0A3S0P5D2_9BACI|nr:DUF2249 domain-containing protein [Lysinibacillus antri]RUL51641.1 DUF2249 domain-containing protein [Lysinibacillus antri]